LEAPSMRMDALVPSLPTDGAPLIFMTEEDFCMIKPVAGLWTRDCFMDISPWSVLIIALDAVRNPRGPLDSVVVLRETGILGIVRLCILRFRKEEKKARVFFSLSRLPYHFFFDFSVFAEKKRKMKVTQEAYAAVLNDTRRMVDQAAASKHRASAIYNDIMGRHPKGTPFAATFQRKPFIRVLQCQITVLITSLIHQRAYLEWTRAAHVHDHETLEFMELKTEWLEAWTEILIKEIEICVAKAQE
jgi:hypothetical protein